MLRKLEDRARAIENLLKIMMTTSRGSVRDCRKVIGRRGGRRT